MQFQKGNKFSVGNNGGRPPHYETAEELIAACEDYFANNKGNLTMTGLVLWLGFSSRQSLADYEKKAEYSDIIKRARLIVEHGYETLLKSEDVSSAGIIFALKNMGWTDKQTIQHEGNPDAPINFTLDERFRDQSNSPVPKDSMGL